MKSALDILLPVLFVSLFVAIWCAACLSLAKFGGWSALARRFPASCAPQGKTLRHCAAKIGSATYSGILMATPTDYGLHLSVLAPWRLGHPRICIPWTEMKNPKERKILWSHWVEVTVSTPKIVTVRLPEKLVEGHLQNV